MLNPGIKTLRILADGHEIHILENGIRPLERNRRPYIGVEIEGLTQSDIDASVSGVAVDGSPTYFYELDNTYYSVTSNTFVGQIFSLFGMSNIADGVEAGNDYPQLSAEVIVTADPDFIFLADTKCCGQTAETVAVRDGWGAMKSVTAGKVIELDDDVASRWGPRVVELVQAIASALNAG